MSCVHGCHEMTDVHGIKGSPEDAESPKPAHERSVATARARPGPRPVLGPLVREVRLARLRTLVR
jgi:hypothetical protein